MIDPLEAATRNALGDMSALIAQNEAWLSELERAGDRGDTMRTPANHLDRFGLSGNCYFGVKTKNGIAYNQVVNLNLSPSGAIVDEFGRPVLGYSSKQPARLVGLRVASGDFARYEIDEKGTLLGIRRQSPGETTDDRVELGRLAIAVFPDSTKLVRIGQDLQASKGSGVPRYFAAGAANMPSPQRNPQSFSSDALRENLRGLWVQSAKAELNLALAGSSDLMVRTALDVVK